MKIFRNLSYLGIALAMAILLVAAACGGDDDDGGDDSDEVTATSAEESRDEADDDGDDSDATPEETDSGDDDDDATPEGDDDDDDSGTEEIDPCELLTLEEVTQALGLEVGEGVTSGDGQFFDCDWEPSSEFEVGNLNLQVMTGSEEDRTYYYELTNEPEELEGLGERAQYDDLIGVEVLTENYLVGVSMINFDLDDEEIRSRSIAVAETVVERIE